MNLEVYFYDTAEQFLQELQIPLERNEVSHGLILGVCMRMARRPELYAEAPCLAAVHDGQEFVLAGMITPPFNLVLAGPGAAIPAEAYIGLSDEFEARSWMPPGVLAPVPMARAFASRWADRQELSTVVNLKQRLFKLTEVIPPELPAAGRMRVAGPADLDLIAGWIYSFGMDVFGHEEPARARVLAETRLEEGDIYLWEKGGRPVSMAARTRPTRHGISIGLVYTPEAERGRGYASHCVAALSQLQLEAGFSYCSLFTDLANPTSNHIYQTIGYRPVHDFWEIRFLPRP